jgi:hypothetical protein
MEKAAEVLERMLWYGRVSKSIGLTGLLDGNEHDWNSEESNNLLNQMV